MSSNKLLALLPVIIIALGMLGCKTLTSTLVVIAESDNVKATPVLPTNTKIPGTPTKVPPAATEIPATETSEPPAATTEAAMPTPEGLRQIIITYVENGSPTAGKQIWLAYYDENAANWVTSSQTTGQDGVVTFGVPSRSSGESYTFTFATTNEDLQKNIDAIKARQKTGLRIPDASQTTLELQLDGQGQMTIKGGSIQFWIP